jgi:hypothetical protein
VGFPPPTYQSGVSWALNRNLNLNLETENSVPFRGNLMFLPSPHISAFPLQMAHFIQFLRRRMTKTSKMLPTVAAVLPVEKLNETLVKWGLLPCCRFSGPLSINHAFLPSFSANHQNGMPADLRGRNLTPAP